MEIKEMQEKITLSIRTKSAADQLPRVLGEGYGEIMQYLGELEENPTGETFVIYYNMDMANLDIELGITVAKEYPTKGRIQSSTIPAGKFAVALHLGPYETLKKTYDELSAFIAKEGHEPQTWAYEVYLNNPQTNPDEEPRTMIYIALK